MKYWDERRIGYGYSDDPEGICLHNERSTTYALSIVSDRELGLVTITEGGSQSFELNLSPDKAIEALEEAIEYIRKHSDLVPGQVEQPTDEEPEPIVLPTGGLAPLTTNISFTAVTKDDFTDLVSSAVGTMKERSFNLSREYHYNDAGSILGYENTYYDKVTFMVREDLDEDDVR